MSGCTAAVSVISKHKIWVVRILFPAFPSCRGLSRTVANSSQANAGDSRSVLGVKGRAKPLSFDHKPQNEGRLFSSSRGAISLLCVG